MYLVCRVVGSGASILLLSSMGSIIYGFFGSWVYVIYILGDGGFVEGSPFCPLSFAFYTLVVGLGGWFDFLNPRGFLGSLLPVS